MLDHAHMDPVRRVFLFRNSKGFHESEDVPNVVHAGPCNSDVLELVFKLLLQVALHLLQQMRRAKPAKQACSPPWWHRSLVRGIAILLHDPLAIRSDEGI